MCLDLKPDGGPVRRRDVMVEHVSAYRGSRRHAAWKRPSASRVAKQVLPTGNASSPPSNTTLARRRPGGSTLACGNGCWSYPCGGRCGARGGAAQRERAAVRERGAEAEAEAGCAVGERARQGHFS